MNFKTITYSIIVTSLMFFNAQTFAQKSKEYSDLGNIISYARSYLKFDHELKELEQILQDKSSDSEMKSLAEKELDSLKQKKIEYTNKLIVLKKKRKPVVYCL